jgi:hypothetical protein
MAENRRFPENDRDLSKNRRKREKFLTGKPECAFYGDT